MTSHTSCVVKDGWRSVRKNEFDIRKIAGIAGIPIACNRRHPFTAVQVADAGGTNTTDVAKGSELGFNVRSCC